MLRRRRRGTQPTRGGDVADDRQASAGEEFVLRTDVMYRPS